MENVSKIKKKGGKSGAEDELFSKISAELFEKENLLTEKEKIFCSEYYLNKLTVFKVSETLNIGLTNAYRLLYKAKTKIKKYLDTGEVSKVVKKNIEKTNDSLYLLNEQIKEIGKKFGFRPRPSLDIPTRIEMINTNKNQNLNDEDKEKKILVLAHSPLVYYIVRSKFGLVKRPSQEDLCQVGHIGLIKASQTFDKSKKIMFTTYASKCIENEIKMTLRVNKKFLNEVYIGDLTPDSNDNGNNDNGNFDSELMMSNIKDKASGGSIDKDYNNKLTCDRILSLIKDNHSFTLREKEVFTKYFMENKTQQVISGEIKLSRSYISRIVDAIRKELKKQCSDEPERENKIE